MQVLVARNYSGQFATATPQSGFRGHSVEIRDQHSEQR